MINNSSCHMCDRPSNGVRGTFIIAQDKLYCSETCKEAHMGTFYVVIGFVMVIIFVFFIPIYAIIGLLGILVGIAVVIYGLYRESLAPSTIRTQSNYGIIPNNDESEPENLMIYSNILKSKVRPCCLQSARLQDRYCACGRALEYPTDPN